MLKSPCQTGKELFTLPICLHEPNALGYPASDWEVFNYFKAVSEANNSVAAHVSIACFLAAAHTIMLEWLQQAQQNNSYMGTLQLLMQWYELVEPQGACNG